MLHPFKTTSLYQCCFDQLNSPAPPSLYSRAFSEGSGSCQALPDASSITFTSPSSISVSEVRVPCSTSITRHRHVRDMLRMYAHTTPSEPPSKNDVEAVTPTHDGSPPITRITFLTCRAHYPGGSIGCSHRYLPRSCSLPRMAGRSASTLSLSRPAQASLILRPVKLLSRPTAAFVTRLQPYQLPSKAARQLPDLSTSIRMGLSPTGDPRLRGARP